MGEWIELGKQVGLPLAAVIVLAWLYWKDLKEQRQILRDELKAEREAREKVTTTFTERLEDLTDVQRERAATFQLSVEALKDLTDEIRDMRRSR